MNTGMTMAQVRPQTLVQCIRSVAADLRGLRKAVADGDAEPEDYAALEGLQAVADDLESAYDALAGGVLNLPPYAELVAE